MQKMKNKIIFFNNEKTKDSSEINWINYSKRKRLIYTNLRNKRNFQMYNKSESKVLQYFCNLRHKFCGFNCFSWDCESDEPHWTMRYWAHLILSECHSQNLPLWHKAQP